jgi:hypothetical protein
MSQLRYLERELYFYGSICVGNESATLFGKRIVLLRKYLCGK